VNEKDMICRTIRNLAKEEEFIFLSTTQHGFVSACRWIREMLYDELLL